LVEIEYKEYVGMTIICVDMAQHERDPASAMNRAVICDPDEIIVIGVENELVQWARNKGHKVTVLPPGTPAPSEAFQLQP
jgi:hypothetical protein